MMTPTLKAVLSCFNPIVNMKTVFIRSESRFQSLDGIRALSVLYVVLTHALVIFMVLDDPNTAYFVKEVPWYAQWMLMGDKAVDAFFVLSGFLISQLLLVEAQRSGRINLTRFYVRRWLRLTPVYWCFLIIFLCFSIDTVNKHYIFAYAFYINNFLEEHHRYIPWLWSLAVEEQFYVIFPLLLSVFLLKAKRPLFWLGGLLLLSLMVRFIILWQNPTLLLSGFDLLVGKPEMSKLYNQALYINLYSRFGPFIMGILLAYGIVFYRQQLMALLTYRFQMCLLLAVALLIAGFSLLPIYSDAVLPTWLYYIYHVGHRHIFALMVCMVILLCLKPLGLSRVVNALLSAKWLYPIAQLSYSMYLIHLPVLFLTWRVLQKKQWISGLSESSVLILSSATLAPLLLFSFILYLLIEAPFMRIRDIKRYRYHVIPSNP